MWEMSENRCYLKPWNSMSIKRVGESKPSIRRLDEKPRISSVFTEFEFKIWKLVQWVHKEENHTLELHIEHLINIVSQDRYFQIWLRYSFLPMSNTKYSSWNDSVWKLHSVALYSKVIVLSFSISNSIQNMF